MGNSPIDILMFTTFSLISIDLNVVEMRNFMSIFLTCFDKVG